MNYIVQLVKKLIQEYFAQTMVFQFATNKSKLALMWCISFQVSFLRSLWIHFTRGSCETHDRTRTVNIVNSLLRDMVSMLVLDNVFNMTVFIVQFSA